MRVLIYCEEKGVFVGAAFGLGFWSKLDPIDQPMAVTFESLQDARDYLVEMKEDPKNYSCIQVDTHGKKYATREEIAATGLPIWEIQSGKERAS